MSLFKPRLKCLLRKRVGSNAYGEHRLDEPVQIGCAVVKLNSVATVTSVRADRSASRGAANEELVDAILLVAKDANVVLNDQIEFHGILLRVNGIVPKFNIKGVHDYNELNLTIWGKP